MKIYIYLYMYRLVSNIRRTSIIRRTPTLGDYQLEFSQTISLAKTSNTSRTLSFDSECRLLTKCEVDPHRPLTGTRMVRAALPGLRFWLTMDYRTNDTSPVSGVCQAYYINTHCEPLYLKCNRISFNKSKRMTPSSLIWSMGSAILLTVRVPVWPADQRFRWASWWKLCRIKWHFQKIILVCD